MESTLTLKYCPLCGSDQFSSGDFKPWICKSCEFELYQNTAGAVGAFIFNDAGELLTLRRSVEPSKGKLGIPGGFIDQGETAEEGLKREVLEEVNLELSELNYLCSFPNEYFYKGILYQTISFYFVAKVSNLDEICALNEVDNYEWHDPYSLKPQDLSFSSFVKALEFWLNKEEVMTRVL